MTNTAGDRPGHTEENNRNFQVDRGSRPWWWIEIMDVDRGGSWLYIVVEDRGGSWSWIMNTTRLIPSSMSHIFLNALNIDTRLNLCSTLSLLINVVNIVILLMCCAAQGISCTSVCPEGGIPHVRLSEVNNRACRTVKPYKANFDLWIREPGIKGSGSYLDFRARLKAAIQTSSCCLWQWHAYVTSNMSEETNKKEQGRSPASCNDLGGPSICSWPTAAYRRNISIAIYFLESE